MAEYNMPQYILREFKVTDARVSEMFEENTILVTGLTKQNKQLRVSFIILLLTLVFVSTGRTVQNRPTVPVHRLAGSWSSKVRRRFH